MREGEVDAVIVVPAGYGEAIAAGAAGPATAPASIMVYHRPVPRRTSLARSTSRSAPCSGVVNLGGRPPLVVPDPETLQTENLNFISYFVPSMLGLSVMQVGIFAAIPLVADREKLILKRLAATPAAALAARRVERPDAPAHRAGPGRHHRRRRRRRLRRRGDRVARSGGRCSSSSARWRSSRSATSSPRSPRPRMPPTA